MEHDPVPGKLINHLPILANAAPPIDIFDKTTWSEHDLSFAHDAFWNYISLKPAHIQCGENLVQTTKFFGKTNVEAKRRTTRCMIHCTFSRDFKAAALNELCQKETDPKKQQQIIKVE